MIIIFRSADPARRSGGVLLSVRAAAQGAPGGKFPNFRLRPAENGRSPLNHAVAARSPCTKPYNHPKIMQIYSFSAPARAAVRYHTATRKRRRALRGKENQFS